MNLRIPLLVAAISSAAISSAAAAAPNECRHDYDCRSGNVCIADKCVAPSREESAARNAGMALLYTRNTWPENIVDRPLMVAPGMTEIQVDVDRDFSAEPNPLPGQIVSTPHPLTSELFARYGVSDRIHAVLDSVGVCFVDCESLGFFRFISAYLGYAAVANHDVNLVTQFGFGAFNVPDAQAAPTSGPTAILVTAIPSVLFAWRVGSALQIATFAALNLGVIGRDHAFVPDLFSLHVEPRIQLANRLTLAPFIGYNLPFAHSEFRTIPVGVGLTYVPDRAVDLGLVFQFADLFSHTYAPVPGSSFDLGGTGQRSATVFVTFRL